MCEQYDFISRSSVPDNDIKVTIAIDIAQRERVGVPEIIIDRRP